MKLRLQSNSVRLRLKRGEVDQLAKTHRVEEKIVMGAGPDDAFHYVLEAAHNISAPQAQLKERGILVRIPVETVVRWATGSEVGIEVKLPAGDSCQLQVLVEKDFACLDGTDGENADTFPNPLAGTKC
jgi:hypothetical protein